MATVSGGIKINRAVAISITNGSVSYTAPANGYAIVQINGTGSFNSGGTGGAVSASTITSIYIGPSQVLGLTATTGNTIGADGVEFVNG